MTIALLKNIRLLERVLISICHYIQRHSINFLNRVTTIRTITSLSHFYLSGQAEFFVDTCKRPYNHKAAYNILIYYENIKNNLKG